MYKPLWEQIISKMRKNTSQQDGRMYLDQVFYLSEEEEGTLTIGIPSNLFKDKMEKMGLKRKIEEGLSEQNGSPVAVNIEVAQNDAAKAGPVTEEKEEEKAAEPPRTNHPALRPEFTFSNFVISPNNELAANASIAISKAPGKSYNPLLIYGGVGM